MSQTASAHATDSVNVQRQDARRAAILAGNMYPSRYDRTIGMPPYRDSPAADLRHLAETEIARDQLPAPILLLLEKMSDAPGRWTAAAVRTALFEVPTAVGFRHGEICDVLDFNLALLGDREARRRVIEDAASYDHRTLQSPEAIYFALGLAHTQATDVERQYEPGDHAELMRDGRTAFEHAVEKAARVQHVRASEAARAAFDEAVELMLEDRSEAFVDPGPRSLQPRATISPLGLVVVPVLPAAGGGARRDMYKSWEGLAGKPLPLVQRGDIRRQFDSLVERWPHCSDVIETIMRDLASRNSVRLRPTLLVGSPGSGKSALAVALAQVLGLPFELHSLAGVHDGAAMGTSAQWHSARESVVLQLIKRTRCANPAVVWDEVDKGGESRHNGSVADVLLGMLERDQAASYRDLALEVPVNLSMVTHLATANDVDLVPAPLRDRFRIMHVPEPTWQHAGVLVRGIVDRIAKDREIDPRWIAPFAGDELDLIKKAWPGGSIRQLERIVGVMVDGRDMTMGRA